MGMGASNHYGAHGHAQPVDRYGNKGGRGAGPGGFNGFNKPPGGGGGYTCNRCGKTGHIAKFCPTVGDAAFDPEIRLMNVPRTGRKTVSSLEGIDTSMSTVIERTDGSYEVFESSSRGMEKLTREGYVLCGYFSFVYLTFVCRNMSDSLLLFISPSQPASR